MIDIERAKSMVESTITYGTPSYMYESSSNAELIGPLNDDTMRSYNLEMDECVVNYEEFMAGANTIMAECAISHRLETLELLQESVWESAKQHVVNAFHKIAEFFKKLAVKFASWVTAHLGNSKAWLKLNQKRILEMASEAEARDIEVQMRGWSAAGLKKLNDIDNTRDALDKYGSPGKALSYGYKASDTEDIQKDVLSTIFKDLSSLGDMGDYVKKKCGISGSEAQKVKLTTGSVKTMMDVVVMANRTGDDIAGKCKELSAVAKRYGDQWQHMKDSYARNQKPDKDNKDARDLTSSYGAIIKACSYIQKCYSKYAVTCQKVLNQAAKECMLSLNAVVKGNDKAIRKAEKEAKKK